MVRVSSQHSDTYINITELTYCCDDELDHKSRSREMNDTAMKIMKILNVPRESVIWFQIGQKISNLFLLNTVKLKCFLYNLELFFITQQKYNPCNHFASEND